MQWGRQRLVMTPIMNLVSKFRWPLGEAFCNTRGRPLSLGNKRFYTQQEADEFKQLAINEASTREAPVNPDRGAPEIGEDIEFRTDTNFLPELPVDVAKISGEFRTSLIIEPANGRFPIKEENIELRSRYFEMMNNNFDGPEARPPGERCLHLGPPLPTMTKFDGTHIQIIRAEDYIVIYSEEAMQARIVRVHGEHLPLCI